MAQASIWAHHLGSRTRKDIASMCGRELVTGVFAYLPVCVFRRQWNHPSLKDLTQSPPRAQDHCQTSFEMGRIEFIFILPHYLSE